MSDTVSSGSDSVAGDQLRAFIERIERMDEELKAINDDKKEIYAEAKGNGFDTKVIKKIVQIRRQDHAERMEQEALLDLYMSALGMQSAPRDEDYGPSGRYEDEDEADDEHGRFQDLGARAPAPARAHVENIDEFRPETNPQGIAEGSAALSTTTAEPSDSYPTPAVGRPNSEPMTGEDTPEVVSTPASGVAIQPEPPEAKLTPAPAPEATLPGQGATVLPFVPAPHDGPYSSTGLKRRKGCLNVDNCAGSAKALCFTCGHAAGAAQDGSATA